MDKLAHSGNIGGEMSNGSRNNLRYGLAPGVLESLLAGISFYLGFYIQRLLVSNLPFTGRMELLLLSIGMAFCYSFIFVYRRSYNSVGIVSKYKACIEVSKNLALAYLLDLGMLFVMKDDSFMAFRLALGIGFIFGLILTFAGRLTASLIISRELPSEGRRRLILTKSAERVSVEPTFRETEDANWAPRSYPGMISVEEEHDSDDLIGAIDILHEGKSRVIIHKQAEASLKNRETLSTRH